MITPSDLLPMAEKLADYIGFLLATQALSLIFSKNFRVLFL